MIFFKNFKLKKKKNSFYFNSFIFSMYYCCSINLKRQSEHSGLRPDTSRFVCTFNFFDRSNKNITSLKTCFWNPGTYRHKIVRQSSAQFCHVRQRKKLPSFIAREVFYQRKDNKTVSSITFVNLTDSRGP